MAISYEPELLLARDQGLKVVSIGALVQRPLTSIIALPGKHVTQRRRPRRQARRHGRHPLPGRRAAHGPRAARRRRSRAACRSQRRLQPDPGDALRQGRRDARRLLELRGDPARAEHKQPIVIPVDRAGVPTYNELVLVVREERGAQATARTCARSCRRSPAASARCAPTRRRPRRCSSRPTRRSNRKLQLESISRPCRRAALRTRQAVRLAEPAGVGGIRRAGCSPTGCCSTTPNGGAAAVHQRVPARPGDLSR